MRKLLWHINHEHVQFINITRKSRSKLLWSYSKFIPYLCGLSSMECYLQHCLWKNSTCSSDCPHFVKLGSTETSKTRWTAENLNIVIMREISQAVLWHTVSVVLTYIALLVQALSKQTGRIWSANPFESETKKKCYDYFPINPTQAEFLGGARQQENVRTLV